VQDYGSAEPILLIGAGHFVPQRGLLEQTAQLLCDSEAGRVTRDVAVKNSPAIMCDHEDAVQGLECERSKSMVRTNFFDS
jgi:hypothetical protein